jgi:hypothetical protein
MSDVVSMVDSLKFENKITKITKTYVGRPKSEDISFCVKSSFFRELSKAKANYSEFSYTDILLFVFISSKRHLCRSEHFFSNSKFS